MFKGKISFYKNVDGKEDRIEEEFDDPRNYREFIAKHPELRFDYFEVPAFGNLWSVLDDIIDRRFRLRMDDAENPASQTLALPEGVRLDEYEKELQKIEAEKAEREASKKSLQEAGNRLKHYISKFKEAGNSEKAEQARKDLEKVEEKLK
jgi:hypothetical protein